MQKEKLSELKNLLSLKYDLDIADITPVKNVMRISTSEGGKCLKRVKYDRGQFLFILSAMRHLQEKGFEGILPFIPSKDNELYIKLDNGFGYLTDWVQARECNYSNPIELKMAVTTLARLHKTSEGFIPMEGAEPRVGFGKWIEKFSKRLQEMKMFRDIIKNKDGLSWFDEAYLEHFDYFYDVGVNAIEHLKETKYLELSDRESRKNSFCHHDYAHHNVLISDDFKTHIIDFDYCICDTRLHDLSSIIIRNMRHGNWNMEKAQYIVDCYLKSGSIEKDEIPVMNAFLEFPQDYWQVGLQCYVEKLKWEESQFNKRLGNVIRDIADRQQFIDEFKFSIEV